MIKSINSELKIDISLFKLKDQNISKIVFEYEGSGDDGAIDDICYFDSLDKIIDISHLDDDIVDSIYNIQEILEDKVDTILEHVSDWYNNEGGHGSVTIYTDTGNYEVDNNIRIVDIQNESYKGKTSTFVDWNSHQKK